MRAGCANQSECRDRSTHQDVRGGNQGIGKLHGTQPLSARLFCAKDKKSEAIASAEKIVRLMPI
jgi:hypothetical protein